MSESTAYDEAIEQAQIRILLRQGNRKFGPVDSASQAQLKSIHDSERLDRLLDAILTANSWQELLATP